MISGDFHIGDKVVYPNHGVGVIEQISSRTIGETVEKFYLLKIKASSLKVMVPFHNVNTVGLRRVVKNGEIQKIVDFLTDGECDNNADWKYRFKENSDRMRTGSLLEVAAVLKGPAPAEPVQAPFLPRKENAGARPLPAGQRAGNGQELRRGPVEDMLAKALAKRSCVPGSLGFCSLERSSVVSLRTSDLRLQISDFKPHYLGRFFYP